ncbi:MAG: DNA repair protein RecN [Eubacteriales bacterium]|nr:DNA repair protein RecN [Eubacteriales bacterium]MDD4541319.1 DNA repair protein RecN [Eubacteriales bacterium]
MLRVEIHDFALVEEVVIEPADGFTVLTGETGAGKSILIDAFEFLSGTRSDRNMVRTGCDEARVEALFQSEDNEELLVLRSLNASGRSYAKINGELVTIRGLREKMKDVLAIHGQNDQQAIFDDSLHRELVDAYAGTEAERLLAEYREQLQNLIRIDDDIIRLGQSPEQRAARQDFLSYQIEEIEAADLQPSEEEELLKRAKTLQAVQSLAEQLNLSLTALSEESDLSAVNLIKQARRSLQEAARYSSKCRQLAEDLEKIESDINELVYELNRTSDKVSYDPEQVAEVDRRLSLIHRLKDKYGKSVTEILDYLEKAREEFSFLKNSERIYDEKIAEREVILNNLALCSSELIEVRQEAARSLAAKIIEELRSLNMKDVFFDVSIKTIPIRGNPPRDPHHVSFLFSANPGEPLKPLINIASGGEASRILLAIKKVLADVDNVSVLIFDEIDRGVAGETSQRIAEKLQSIGQFRQVLCVTHSAPIAAAANKHLLITKAVDKKRSRTNVMELKKDDRVTEIARLLSGNTNESESRSLALSLLETHGNLN